MAKRRSPRKRTFTLPQARDRARWLTTALAQAGVITTGEDIEFAGSLRRREDTIGDLDVLLIDLPDDRWDKLADVEGLTLTSSGDRKASGTFDDIRVDLRRVACDEVGAALEYFTGPKAHNIGMRAKAKRQGMKLNEYGLFDAKSGDKVAGRTERGIYQALGHKMKRPGDRRKNPPESYDLQFVKEFLRHQRAIGGEEAVQEAIENARQRIESGETTGLVAPNTITVTSMSIPNGHQLPTDYIRSGRAVQGWAILHRWVGGQIGYDIGKWENPEKSMGWTAPIRRDNPGHVPPQGVQQAAQRGLDLRREFGRGGTAVGIARARDLARGAAVSDDTIMRMASFFARHAVDKRPGWSKPSNPSNGYIAWLLWGGDAGRSWANKVKQQITRDNPPRLNPGGDIWDLQQGSAWIVVPTNGVIGKNGNAIMGKGLALQAAKRFPPTWVEAAHWRDPRTGTQMEREGYEDPGIKAALGERLRLAKLSYPNDPYRWNKPFRFDEYRIFTFPTKFDYRAKSDLALIESSAKQLADLIINWAPGLDRKPLYLRQQHPSTGSERGVPFDHECPVFMPHVGTGAGGLDWADVEPIIREYLGSLVTIVPPAKPSPRKRKAAKRKPTRLTKRASRTKKKAVRANPPQPAGWEGEAASEWVWPVIDHNWTAINDLVRAYGEPDWDRLIDCGAMGCIVPFVDNERLIIKVTTDETEGAIVRRLIDTGLDKTEPGLTRYNGVWRLDVPEGLVAVEAPSGFTDVGGDALDVWCAYLVVRENVQPWSQVEAAGYAEELGRLGIVTPGPNGRCTIPWVPFLEGAQAALAIGDMGTFAQNCELLMAFDETHDLALAMCAMAKQGVFLADQHFDNLGFRLFAPSGQRRTLVEWLDGKRRPPLLTLDVGQSHMPGNDPESCDLDTPTRRANPWVTKALRRIPTIP